MYIGLCKIKMFYLFFEKGDMTLKKRTKYKNACGCHYSLSLAFVLPY